MSTARTRPSSPESAPGGRARISGSRDLALTVIRDVFGPEARGAQASFAVRARRSTLDARDRAFAADLAYGTIKTRRLLDWYLSPYVGDRMKTLPSVIAEILRLGAYQIVRQEGVDAHAAVYETVALALRYGHKGTAGLVNAVLRRLSAEPPRPPAPEDFESEDDFLGTRWSLPTWIVARLRARFPDRIAEIAEGLSRPPQHALRFDGDESDVADLERACLELGATPHRSALVGDVFVGTGSLGDDPAGRWVVQSEISALPVALLDPRPGEHVVDLCSGRGHKSVQIGRRLENAGELFCVERDARKIPVLERALALGRVEIGAVVAGDAAHDLGLPPADAVLVDAPCSGLGILGRHPEARWRKRPEDAERLAPAQTAILARAAGLVRPGGRLVYAVCSTDAREGSAHVTAFLAAHDTFSRAPVPPALAEFERDGEIVVPPGIDGRDGFTIVRLDRAPVP